MGTNYYWLIDDNSNGNDSHHIGKRCGYGIGKCQFIWRDMWYWQKLKDLADKDSSNLVIDECGTKFTASEFLEIINVCIKFSENNSEFC